MGNALDFPSAIHEVVNGKRITRLDWDDTRTYGLLANGFLMLHKAGESATTFRQWLLSDGDLLADDWVVLDQVLD